MKPKRKELKNLLKKLAIEIKETKSKHKEVQRKQRGGGSDYEWSLHRKSYDYRHYHIAYSELRGKTRDQIEKPKEDNLPNEDIIASIKKEYFDEPETLCISA